MMVWIKTHVARTVCLCVSSVRYGTLEALRAHTLHSLPKHSARNRAHRISEDNSLQGADVGLRVKQSNWKFLDVVAEKGSACASDML